MAYSDGTIRIAFVVWTLEGMGGSERVVYDIVRKLDKKIFSPYIISFREGPDRKVYEDIGVRVKVFFKKKRFDLKFIIRFKKILLSERIDIINPHHFSPFFYSFLATYRARTKLVYTEHSKWQLEELHGLERILNRIMLLKSDAVIAISKQIEEYYLNSLGLKRDKIYLIQNGIDLERYKKVNCNHLYQEFGIKPHEKVIGIVANIRPEKNHKILISAFSLVAKEVRDVRLVLVGIDLMEGEVQRFASKSDVADRIIYAGPRNDVPELLNLFDVFCLPSFHEGLPLTVLEAMAAGTPVIGSDVLGINEVISHNENGLLFAKNDEKSLAENIQKLLGDTRLRDRLSKSGRSFVEKNHCLDEKVKEYDRLFRMLCHN